MARELGLLEHMLRNWIKAAQAGKLSGAGSKAAIVEQMELWRLRAENIRLQRQLEITREAAA